MTSMSHMVHLKFLAIWRLGEEWKLLLDFMSSIVYSINHIFWDTNQAANLLAKFGATDSQLRYSDSRELPQEFREILHVDRLGRPTLRQM